MNGESVAIVTDSISAEALGVFQSEKRRLTERRAGRGGSRVDNRPGLTQCDSRHIPQYRSLLRQATPGSWKSSTRRARYRNPCEASAGQLGARKSACKHEHNSLRLVLNVDDEETLVVRSLGDELDTVSEAVLRSSRGDAKVDRTIVLVDGDEVLLPSIRLGNVYRKMRGSAVARAVPRRPKRERPPPRRWSGSTRRTEKGTTHSWRHRRC